MRFLLPDFWTGQDYYANYLQNYAHYRTCFYDDMKVTGVYGRIPGLPWDSTTNDSNVPTIPEIRSVVEFYNGQGLSCWWELWIAPENTLEEVFSSPYFVAIVELFAYGGNTIVVCDHEVADGLHSRWPQVKVYYANVAEQCLEPLYQQAAAVSALNVCTVADDSFVPLYSSLPERQELSDGFYLIPPCNDIFMSLLYVMHYTVRPEHVLDSIIACIGKERTL
jgi:hypothetical protein